LVRNSLVNVTLDWLDRPIRHGDPFVVLSPCRVVSGHRAWLLRPAEGGRGIWASVAAELTDPAGLVAPRSVPWYPFDTVVWEVGHAYQLRIRLGDAPGVLTGAVATIDGQFR
jgi:hypothetical protein